ncbi:hypothetical protein O4H61_00540 [Roseovarius aestuarii]|nr:hypothetical protein [Roseovarius aestuarii]
MKPNFALTLSFQGIGLLYRGAPGWQAVGDVSLDSPDLTADLAELRSRAEALAPGEVMCKLIIPDEQIKYLYIETEGDPDEAVRAALDGATPYAVDDLYYDWSAQDGRVQVAAVARETLAEAEAFAAEHDFAPVSFAAMPSTEQFSGEPFFGTTKQAKRIVPDGAEIERDTDVIAVVGPVTLPAPQADPVPAPEDPISPDDADVLQDASQSFGETEAETEVTTPKPYNAADNDAVASEQDAQTSAETTPEATASAQPKQAKTAPAPQAVPSGDGPIVFASIRARRSLEPSSSAPPLSGQPRANRVEGSLIATPPSPDLPTDETAAPAPPIPGPGGDALAPPPEISEIAASLRSDPDARPAPKSRGATVLATVASGAAAALKRRKARKKPAKSAPVKASKAEIESAAPSAKKKGLFRSGKAKPAATASIEDERQRMTVFGARQHDVGGKPRFLGLILTAVLLLFLVGVAAWASLFLDEGLSSLFGEPEDIRLTEAPAEDTTEATADAEDPIASVPQLQIDPLPDAGEDIAALEPAITPLPQSDITQLPNTSDALSPSEALARYAATGIWQMAPSPPDAPAAQHGLDELYQVSLDPSVARPKVNERQETGPFGRLDVRPETPPDPPPPGVLFDFDENGFVRATPDGAMTPQGVRVFAGRPDPSPPVVMQQTPPTTTGTATTDQPDTDVAASDPAQSTPDATDTGAEQSADASTDVTVLDPALASVRPRLRPGSIAQDAADATTDTTESPAADSALAALRPRLRPASVSAQAATLRSTQDAATTPLVDTAAVDRALAQADQADIADAELDDSEPDSFDDALPQAVSASLVPLKRPDNFEATVNKSRTVAAAQPVAASQAMSPSLPSSASVAKQATEKNMINLRQVNLIGVYGSPASRRALVRLSNGRYKKVQVGDKLDGGQVAAIGDSELRYVKRGRAVILQMPKG